jgi:hypothetical protein
MGMMYSRNIFFMLLLFFCGNAVSGQSKNSTGASSVQHEFGKDFSLKSDDSLGLNVTDAYHLRGDRMEQLLSDGQSRKDDRLPEGEFIIERSPLIKIEYTPAKSRSEIKTEKPL